MLDMTRITKEILQKLGACEDGLNWWINNGLEGFPVKDLRKIKGDYNDYISWLKDKFYNCTYDSNGNCLTYKDSNDFSWERTYDSNGNYLTYKDGSDYSWKKTYDSNGNCLTHKYSNGYSWKKTYDSNGNCLTCKDGSDYSWKNTFIIKHNKFIINDGECIIPLDWR